MKFDRVRYVRYTLFLAYFVGGLTAITLSYIHHWHKEPVGLAIFLGSILALFIPSSLYNSNFIQESKEIEHISATYKLSLIIFLILSFISVIIFMDFKLNYYFPLKYFIIISLSSVLISLQILLPISISRIKEYLTLLEIFVLSTMVSSFSLFLFPSSYGNDSPYHAMFIKSIIASGNFREIYGHYQNYPIYHLLFISIDLLGGIEDLKLIQFIISVIEILFLVFLYIIVKKFFDKKVALLSFLIISLSPYLLQARFTYYPCVFTVIFFILIFNLFYYPSTKTSNTSFLMFIIFIVIIFSHPLTPAILITIFFIIYIFNRYLNFKGTKMSEAFLLVISIITLSWWMKPIGVQMDLFSGMILSAKYALQNPDYEAVTTATLAPLYNWTDVVLYDLGFIILISLGIIGSFYSLKNIRIMKKSMQDKERLLTLSIVTLLIIPIPYLLAIIYPLSLPDRWFPFITIFAGVFASVSIILLYQMLTKYKLHYIVVLIIFLLVFFMITTPITNPNAKIYGEAFSGRSALTSSEIAAADFVNRIAPNELYGNSKYLPFINMRYLDSEKFINPTEPHTYCHGLVVLRKYDLEKGFTIPLYGAKGKLLEIVYPDNRFYDAINHSNKLYENYDAKIYFGDSI